MNQYTVQDIEKLLNDNNVTFSKIENDTLNFFTIYTSFEKSEMIKTANKQYKGLKEIENISINRDVFGEKEGCYYRQVKVY